MTEAEKAVATFFYLGQLASQDCAPDTGVTIAIVYPEEYGGAPAWEASLDNKEGIEVGNLGSSLHEAVELLYNQLHATVKPLEMHSVEGTYEIKPTA